MGVFDGNANLFTAYRCKLQFRDRIFGGTPKNAQIIEAWLRKQAGVDQKEELRQMLLRTLVDLGADVRPNMTFEELEQASEALAEHKQTNGFKIDDGGLPYVEGRTVKAMLKENTNILYAAERWGPTRKGAKAFLAERVFVDPDKISLGKPVSGVEMFIGHTSGPQGRRSNLTYYEYVEQPEIAFTVRVAEDAIDPKAWPRIWLLAQENGLGALRSQGFGRFEVTEWEQVEEGAKKRARLAVTG